MLAKRSVARCFSASISRCEAQIPHALNTDTACAKYPDTRIIKKLMVKVIEKGGLEIKIDDVMIT